MSKKSKTVPYNTKVDEDQLIKAKSLVNLPEAFRNLINQITKSKVCPCCGSKLKEG